MALIGIYGSVATGEEYEKSDLDLLILIQNGEGWQLGTGFILDDSKVGYDIYCTNWDGIKYDAECHHAQLAKLMDSKIVYIKNQEAYEELCKLREQAEKFMESGERFQRVSELLDKAKLSYANAYLHETLGQVRLDIFAVMYYLMDAVFIDSIKSVVSSTDVSELRALAKSLMLYAEGYTRQVKEKKEPSKDLCGTYEEMYSNWRNKVEEAAEKNNV